MVRIQSRQPVQVRTAAIQITPLIAITLVIAANSAIAQQAPPATPQQQIGQAPAEQPEAPGPVKDFSGTLSAGATPTVTVAAPTLMMNPVISDVRVSPIFGCHESQCGHVIDLLISNRLRQQTGAFGAELAPGLIHSAPPLVTQLGDLELLNVRLVSDGCATVGPVIQVEIRNNSAIAVGFFQISIVGVLGQIHAQSPTVQGTVAQIPAGAVSQFQLQLPASAMAMQLPGQQSAAFDTVIVAIDSFDELLESSELNNVRIIRRVELLPTAVPAVGTAIDVPPTTLGEPAKAPPADTAIPSPAQPASPLDSILLENHQLETTQPTAAGMAQYFCGTL